MKSLDKTARFHVLYQNKGYDIVVKVVTALLALVHALTKKKKKLFATRTFYLGYST